MDHCAGTNTGHKESGNTKRRLGANSTSLAVKDHTLSEIASSPAKKKKRLDSNTKQKSDLVKTLPLDRDAYCWLCHRDGKVIKCAACPRVFHLRCLSMQIEAKDEWVCAECERVVLGENVDTRSSAMRKITVDQLCVLLKFALNRMKHHGDEAFLKPVSSEEFPTYKNYVYQPMDLTTLEKNIRKKMYGSTESFLSDAKWILHNCIIFNGYQHRLTSSAKTMIKVCKFEMNEIEVCPDCYLNSYTNRDSWFCEPCREPHPLIWAKLKGFPYWPAKAMKVINGNVDVRFFGAHDRAWIPLAQCFLLCRDIPTAMKNKKKGSFEQSMEELANHIERLKERFGQFQYAPFRSSLDPNDLSSHIATFLPQSKKRLNETPMLQSKKARLLDRTSRTSPIKHADSDDLLSGLSSSSTPNKSADSTPSILMNSACQSTAPKIRSRMGGSAGRQSSSRSTTNANKNCSSSASERITIAAESLPTVEVKIPKLKLHCMKKLESTIERLKENVAEKSEDEEEAESVIADRERDEKPTGSASSEEEDGIDGTEKLSQLCEVTSTTTGADSVTGSNVTAACDSSPTVGSSPLKKSSAFAQKLDQTIESCKAKLGIDDVNEEPLLVEESSDDEWQDDGGTADGNEENNAVKNEGEEIQNTTSMNVSLVKDETDNNTERCEEILLVDQVKQSSMEGSSSGKECSRNIVCNDLDMECSDDGDLIIDLNRDSMAEDSDAAEKFKVIPSQTPIGGGDGAICDRRARRVRSRATSGESSLSRQTTGVSGRINSQTPPVSQKGPVTVINISSSHPRPSFTPKTVAQMAPPSSPGPGCDMNKYSRKMMDFMRGTVEEMFRDMAKSGNLEASVKTLQLEIEKLHWRHQQELAEIKHNTDLILLEMRASMESEKQRSISEVRRQCEIEKQKAVEETKRKQWCANCSKEAIFYCCWNTSYCDYPCQQAHWPQHMSTCAQSQGNGESEASTETTTVLPTITNTSGNASNKLSSSTGPYNQIQQRAAQQTSSELSGNDAWLRKSQDEVSFKRQQEDQGEKQQRQLTVQPIVNQTSPAPHYQTPLVPVQYIPSNAVQVIPQTSSLASSSALQVQYVSNLSPNSSRAVSMASGTPSQFTTMTTAPAFPVVQNVTNSPLGQRNLTQPRTIQMPPNSMYPIVIQSATQLAGQNTNSHSYPRGPYIPGKPYHLS